MYPNGCYTLTETARFDEDEKDELDWITEEGQARTAPVMRRWIQVIRRHLEKENREGRSLEEAMETIPGLFVAMKRTQFEQSLADALILAGYLGQDSANEEIQGADS